MRGQMLHLLSHVRLLPAHHDVDHLHGLGNDALLPDNDNHLCNRNGPLLSTAQLPNDQYHVPRLGLLSHALLGNDYLRRRSVISVI